MADLTLTYSGDCTDTLLADGGQVVGRDTAGGYLRVTAAEYDPAAGRTRAWFAPLAPDELIRAAVDLFGLPRLDVPREHTLDAREAAVEWWRR